VKQVVELERLIEVGLAIEDGDGDVAVAVEDGSSSSG
jgi:hypothetical protein